MEICALLEPGDDLPGFWRDVLERVYWEDAKELVFSQAGWVR